MLENRYQDQLDEMEKFNENKRNIDQMLSKENIEKPDDEYKTPQHIRFKVSTVTVPGVEDNQFGQETCDIRLTSIRKLEAPVGGETTSPKIETIHNSDVFFYRMGYYNYHKLNSSNMVQKFKGEKWYQVDILVNWGDGKFNAEGSKPVKDEQILDIASNQ